MIRKFSSFTLALCLFLSVSAVCRGAEADLMVYVTNTGERYHREGCSSLRRSRIPISLGEAVRSGYGPCSICKPPSLSENALIPEEPRPPLYRVNVAELALSAEAELPRMVPAEVIDHVDGDTVRVRIQNAPDQVGPVETIRLIGVDTPETVHPSKPVERFGKEASNFTREGLLGKSVYLAFDWDLRDRYGRLLAYIYTGDGRCFNAFLIREGYGFAYTRFPFQFMEEFRTLERQARDEKRGLWGDNS
ncbi:thermonuclease family protein [Treponema sp. TIM-1]|uniref:thermonuclease family protein n=1 Tax=Treponema sp. TIM-1 TaxID=2898417 RepID=UPI00397E986D